MRSIRVLPEHANANGETEFSVLEVHNSYHQYIELYLSGLEPSIRQRRIIPCDDILRKAFENYFEKMSYFWLPLRRTFAVFNS